VRVVVVMINAKMNKNIKTKNNNKYNATDYDISGLLVYKHCLKRRYDAKIKQWRQQ